MRFGVGVWMGLSKNLDKKTRFYLNIGPLLGCRACFSGSGGPDRRADRDEFWGYCHLAAG